MIISVVILDLFLSSFFFFLFFFQIDKVWKVTSCGSYMERRRAGVLSLVFR